MNGRMVSLLVIGGRDARSRGAKPPRNKAATSRRTPH